jgi:hypothetical protein
MPPASAAFMRLYTDDAQFGHVFASIHERLYGHFNSINDRAKTTRHYWAHNSREMLEMIDELDNTLNTLLAGFEVVFAAEYRAAIDRCKPWLAMSNGSTAPEDFELIRLIKYEPVFIRPETNVRLKKQHLMQSFTPSLTPTTASSSRSNVRRKVWASATSTGSSGNFRS